eukprot:COSAG02_NODE_15720_length_1146_cov_1.742120_2_plen_28_part_01
MLTYCDKVRTSQYTPGGCSKGAILSKKN